MRCSRRITTQLFLLDLAGMVAIAFYAGCDSTAPADMNGRGRPVATRPATQPTSQEGAETRPSEPPMPVYLTVSARLWPDRPTRVSARVEPVNRLVIDTQNVRRLCIRRNELPLDGKKRIVLQLDSQGIEWTAGSKVVEFERSDNGVWSPVVPHEPRRP